MEGISPRGAQRPRQNPRPSQDAGSENGSELRNSQPRGIVMTFDEEERIKTMAEVVGCLVTLGIVGVVIWVVAHFIAKFW